MKRRRFFARIIPRRFSKMFRPFRGHLPLRPKSGPQPLPSPPPAPAPPPPPGAHCTPEPTPGGSGPDNYPGDNSFTEILQDIYHGDDRQSGISHDKIMLRAYKNQGRSDCTWTRTQIVTFLLNRYAAPVVGAGGATCQSHLFGTTFTVAAAVNALTYPSAYNDASGLQEWAGTHNGTWYSDDGNTFIDNAIWHSPREKGSHIATDGSPYQFQPVDFLGSGAAVEKNGWNQTHRDVEYVWGWDPKNNGQHSGQVGAHLGFPFSEDGAEAIIWFTRRECFFEAVRIVSGVKKRISVGIWGRGLWTV